MDEPKVFLIGGGEIISRETEEIDRAALAARKKSGAIVFVGAAANDSESYYECFKNYYASMCDEKDFVMLNLPLQPKKRERFYLALAWFILVAVARKFCMMSSKNGAVNSFWKMP